MITEGKEVKVPFKFQMTLPWLVKFTWKERVKIAFGYRAAVMVVVLCRHNAGELDPKLIIKITGETDAEKAFVGVKTGE